MKREIQLIFAALLIALLDYILLDDYKDACISAIAVFIAYLFYRYQDRIRDDWKLMIILRKMF